MLESIFLGRLQAPATLQPVCQRGVSQTVIVAFNGQRQHLQLALFIVLSVVSVRQMVA